MNKCLLLILPMLALFSVSAFAVSYQIYPSDDSSVSNSSAATNYGTNANLLAAQQSNMIWRSYLKFTNTSIIPSNAIISSANLCMYETSLGPFGTNQWLVYNTTNNWTETNISWTNKTLESILQSNNTILSGGGYIWKCFNVTNALTSSLSTGILNLFIRANNETNGPTWMLAFASKENSGSHPFVEVNFTNNDCATTLIGSVCDRVNNLDAQGHPLAIWTYKDFTCTNDTYYVCPSGTECTQILPQANITTPIVEDLVDCSVCWYQKMNVGTFLNPIWETRYTNCGAYPQCDNCNGAFCYGNTFQSNLSTTPVSLNQYAAGCVNSVGTVINIVLGNGTNTTVQGITDEIFPDANYTYNVTMPTCTNTTTTCYDINCIHVDCTIIVSDNYADQIALAIGSTVGVQDLATARTMSSLLMTMLGAAGVLVLFATMKIHGQILGQSFLISLLMFLVLFTLIGWFPSWLMVVLMVISGLMIAKTLKVF